jgi:hypothetical protein
MEKAIDRMRIQGNLNDTANSDSADARPILASLIVQNESEHCCHSAGCVLWQWLRAQSSRIDNQQKASGLLFGIQKLGKSLSS